MVRFNDKKNITTLASNDIMPITDISEPLDDKKVTVNQLSKYTVDNISTLSSGKMLTDNNLTNALKNNYDEAYNDVAEGIATYSATKTYNKTAIVKLADEDGKPVLYYSLQDNNTNHNPTEEDSEYWAELKTGGGGGGLELATVVCMPFGIDESENKYRYLNGQTIIQSQYPAFTNKVKSWTSTRPNLFTTETNWQAEKTASKLGQCGKFVIDDNAGTIRLPLVVNINGLTDLANCGVVKNESLPNHSHYLSSRQVYQGGNQNFGYYVATLNNALTGDVANNPTYQDNAPVQQEAIQYPYVIVVNTGVEEAKRPINNYQVNNVYSLFDCKFADHKLDNLSWLRSEGQYNDGNVYTAAYNELLTEYNNEESTEETENEITFKRTPKGYKIALASQKSTIDNLYTTTGVAWYYVLDTENEQFMLPRTKYGFSGVRDKVGDYIAESLPNITGQIGFKAETYPDDVLFATSRANIYGESSGGSAYGDQIAFDASRYSSTYQDNAPVQERSTEMYLYFYIGDTLQNADLVNIARLEEGLVDIKSAINKLVTYETDWFDIAAGSIYAFSLASEKIARCDYSKLSVQLVLKVKKAVGSFAVGDIVYPTFANYNGSSASVEIGTTVCFHGNTITLAFGSDPNIVNGNASSGSGYILPKANVTCKVILKGEIND